MKQTAVDWLFKELLERPKDKMVWYYILEKAKQMEKEQIIYVFEDAYDIGYNDNYNYSAEQYYQENYEQK